MLFIWSYRNRYYDSDSEENENIFNTSDSCCNFDSKYPSFYEEVQESLKSEVNFLNARISNQNKEFEAIQRRFKTKINSQHVSTIK